MPPADRWFSRLPLGEAMPRVVPLAFHVEYWDYIGWKDRFADPAWRARQREAVRRSGGRIVYTPQAMHDGRDFPHWHAAGSLAREAAGDARARALIAIRLSAAPSGLVLDAQVQPAGANRGAGELFLALTQSRLVTTVRAGENRGKSLSHDHVVRRLASLGPLDGSRASFRHVFALEADRKPADLAVAAFVQDTGTGEVHQAVRLENCAR